MTESKSTALVVRQTGSLSTTAYEPETWEELTKRAAFLAVSGMVPTALKNNAPSIAVIGMKAREMGVTLMTGLSHIHVIEGRPSPDAQLQMWQVHGARLSDGRPVCRYFHLVESDNTKCTYETFREGAPGPSRMTLTMKDIPDVLTKKDNWRNYPGDMLRARCQTKLAHAVYPDVLVGMSDEETIGESRSPGPGPGSRIEPMVVNQVVVEKPENPEKPPASAPSIQDAEIVTTPAPETPAVIDGTVAHPDVGVIVPQDRLDYVSMSAAQKQIYWKEQLDAAPDEKVLTAIVKALDAVEPADSPIRKQLNPVYGAARKRIREAAEKAAEKPTT